ncbi:unnamed protein product, partial [Schistocephalus solidus]|uniref:LITAF domain-containing protein n=1 Tax=Schistocephalus solidus TaxID=70667 RepID=A0A183T1Z9_SCHSO
FIAPQVVIIEAQPTLGHDPVDAVCSGCNKKIKTNVEYKVGNCTWLSCALIFALLGPCFCFLIPFCIDNYKDAIHTCPQCGQNIGFYKRL